MGDTVECPHCGFCISAAAQRYARAGLRCRRCRSVELADFIEPEPPEVWVPEHYEKPPEERELDKLCEGTDDDDDDNAEW